MKVWFGERRSKIEIARGCTIGAEKPGLNTFALGRREQAILPVRMRLRTSAVATGQRLNPDRETELIHHVIACVSGSIVAQRVDALANCLPVDPLQLD